MTTTIDLDNLVLAKGGHANRSDGVCIMEAVAWWAGQKHTDAPACVSPVLRAFALNWNDNLDDTARQRLKPYIPRLAGTAGDKEIDARRAWMATDWLVRVHTPAWLRLAGLEANAAALESLPELTDGGRVPSIMPALEAARRDADAAWAAAGAAARAAARAAAGAAAGDAAWDAAWAAAGAAARAAAGAAARAAARAAAGQKLAPTVKQLQESGFKLLDRMIDVGRAEV